MDGVRDLTSPGPSRPLCRGPQFQRVHCSVAAAILGRGSREVVGGSFRAISAPGWGAVVPTRAIYSPIASLQFFRPPIIIMAGFKLQAWIVPRGRLTTPHSLMYRFVLLLSP
ncbi:hypothetical protein NDU88_004986 [Pleurodeles waltl]|uniref:Uncharacterized protein n=1 Tax=Pleurodeles waltl TaxID=8319 RepID=A0AAV7RM08_PLEWA|nr:hypothetical protein NDU88_004986 [Pleurodeles waltl]